MTTETMTAEDFERSREYLGMARSEMAAALKGYDFQDVIQFGFGNKPIPADVAQRIEEMKRQQRAHTS